MARSFRPGENIRLELTAAERKLLLDSVLLLDDDEAIAQAIRDAPPDRPVLLTLDELEQLAEDLAAAKNHAKNEEFRTEVDRLYDKVVALSDSLDP